MSVIGHSPPPRNEARRRWSPERTAEASMDDQHKPMLDAARFAAKTTARIGKTRNQERRMTKSRGIRGNAIFRNDSGEKCTSSDAMGSDAKTQTTKH
jgi:hypothetical protein